ncbi:MAG: ArnT family glycosyltransferase, partial [Isosphaeraceae bacterium]
LVAILGLEAGLAVARARHVASVLAGRESSESFLARREPTYEVGRWAGTNLPTGARLIGQDHRGFYIPRPYTMELAHRRRTGLGRQGEHPDQIVERLRTEGFTHLMLCPPVPESAVEFDPTLGRLLAPWLARRQPIYRRDIADGDGVLRRYAIYELSDHRVASGPPGGTTR